MSLKNYTSSVSASRSISYIEEKLVQHGAKQILKLYDGKQRVSGICFIMLYEGAEIPYKLPARLPECEKILRQNLSSRTRPETIQKLGEQAERTAWKILLDWVDAQMALIELSQVEMMEVFLPYVYDYQKRQTYFEALKEKGFKALLPAGKTT
ncbi:MAG: hypothetical protein PHH26_00555 [Candidatus Thermoplasmatota archaeon]|nr:hypothetical protein [Candidatus Thermoplasmatota archaeon]